MKLRMIRRGLLLALACGLAVPPVRAQAPVTDTGSLPAGPGGPGSALGPAPGAGGGVFTTNQPGAGAILGARPGASMPHGLPAALGNPGGAPPSTESTAITAPPAQPITPAAGPLLGTLEIPSRPDEDGPPNGLTLDQAIDRMLQGNLDLRNKFYEIPQAQADILQASLRSNPVFYADGQLEQYGKFNRSRPGGPSQYDININYPVDVTFKRLARTEVATRARKVIEAQYQDAVRQKLNDLYTAYVNALAARQTVRYATESVRGLTLLVEKTSQLFKRGQVPANVLSRVLIQLRTARLGLLDAQVAYRQAKLDLASVLNLSPEETNSLDLRGTIFDLAPPPPPRDELQKIALDARPDILAFQLGLKRAEADVRLAKANRMNDVFVLLQPYTYQDNTPYGLKSAYSWAMGVSVPLPVYNRNQGTIQRASLNVSQTQIQLADLQRQVQIDLDQAINEYAVTRQESGEMLRDILPAARQMRDSAQQLFNAGQTSIIDYTNALLDYNQVVKQFLDTAIRHRRSMLALNTVVGRRVMP